MNISTEEFMKILYAPLLEHADDFALSKLYLGALGSHERIMQDGKTMQMWHNMVDFDHFISDINVFSSQLPHNINYTVTPRTRPESKKPYVAGSTCFWADIDDFLYYRWKQVKYPKLVNTWLEPNIAVNSGWGVHLYWLFDDFVPFGDGMGIAINAEQFNKYMKILSWYLSADLATAEHLLRVPGTCNCKSSPDKLTEIHMLSARRRRFSDLAADLDSGIRGIMESERTPAAVKNTIAAMFRKSGNTASDKTYNNQAADVKSVASAVEALKALSGECRLFEKAFYAPDELSYRAWFSAGAAIQHAVRDPQLAREIFYIISLPGNSSADPQGEIHRMFDNLKSNNYMPFGGAKIPECTGCKLFTEGKCNNIITIVRKALRNIK